MHAFSPAVWLALALAGGFGTVARAGLGLLAARWWGAGLPWGTFAANFIGAFAIGAVIELERRAGWLSPEARFVAATGFLGGFTTFSAMSAEVWGFIERGTPAIAVAYALGSVACGIAATAAGIAVARGITGG